MSSFRQFLLCLSMVALLTVGACAPPNPPPPPDGTGIHVPTPRDVARAQRAADPLLTDRERECQEMPTYSAWLRGCHYVRYNGSLGAECEAGDHSACNRVVTALLESAEPPMELVFSIYESSCAAGWAGACHALGERKLLGDGTPFDAEGAQGLLRRGCELHHAPSCHLLGTNLVNGRLASGARDEGMRLLHDACFAGRVEACRELGPWQAAR